MIRYPDQTLGQIDSTSRMRGPRAAGCVVVDCDARPTTAPLDAPVQVVRSGPRVVQKPKKSPVRKKKAR